MSNELDIDTKFKGIGKESAEKLKFSEALVEREKSEYEAHRALYNLAIKNVADTVRKSVAYPWASLFIEDARKWLSMQKEGIDQRKNYTEKQSYDNFVRQLNQIFDRDDILILDITPYNYSEAWFVRFVTKNDFIFLLDIPNIAQINSKNVYDQGLGKLKFGYLDKDCDRYVASSYNPTMFRYTLTDIIDSGCSHFSIIDDLDRLPAGWINQELQERNPYQEDIMNPELVYFELNNWFSGRDYPNFEPFKTWVGSYILDNDDWCRENRLVVLSGVIDMSKNWCIIATKSWVQAHCPELLEDLPYTYVTKLHGKNGVQLQEHKKNISDFLRHPDEDGAVYGQDGWRFPEYTEENFGVHEHDCD